MKNCWLGVVVASLFARSPIDHWLENMDFSDVHSDGNNQSILGLILLRGGLLVSMP